MRGLKLKNYRDKSLVVIREKKDGVRKTFPTPCTMPDVKRDEKLLKSYNALLNSNRIEVVYGDELRVYDDHHIQRIYSSRKRNMGGRFYGGFWMSGDMKKKFRKNILINGEETVELDFTAQHIYMLYDMAGIEKNTSSNADPYYLAGYDRDLVKSCVLVSLNCNSYMEASHAIRSELRKKATNKNASLESREKAKIYLEKLKGKGKIKGLMNAFKDRHSEIAYLFEDEFLKSRKHALGLELQYLDSKVADYVIRKFTEMDIPVLGVHDSFICQKKYELILKDTMQNAYKHVKPPILGPVSKLVFNAQFEDMVNAVA